MHPLATHLSVVLALLCPALASAAITFYTNDDFQGEAVTADRALVSLRDISLNDKVSSVVVQGAPWEVCEHDEFRGKCVVLRPGGYRSLREMNLNDRLSSARQLRAGDRPAESQYAPMPLDGQITVFEHDAFRGQAMTFREEVQDLSSISFNDRASSLVVLGSRWEACSDSRFRGRCVVLRPGRYPSLKDTGLNDRVSSIREVPPWERVEESRYAPVPLLAYDGRPRPQDRLYQAEVISARAVFNLPEERCWIDQDRLAATLQARKNPRPGSTWGGGIIAHQVGNVDVGLQGGAVTGGSVGAAALSNARRDDLQQMKRCTSIPGQTEEYWDVIYIFRGVQHHVQSLSPPGRSIPVNGNGDPRA